jgi:hypothetical protein
VALHGGVLHVFGGETGDADGAKDGTDEVFVARPDANANFGPFTKALPLPTPRVRMAAAATQSAVYLIGGKKSREAPADGSVIVARLDERGDVIGYEDAPPLPEPREGASAVVVNRRLYLAGGYFFENEKPCAAGTVLVSVIDADGKPGPWRPTTSVPALPAGAALAASGNVLYLVGGIGDQGDTVDGSVVGSVLCARAGGDGGLSTWRRAAHLADRRYGHSVAVAGGKLFAFGGLVNDVDVLADVLALPLAGAAGRCAE